MLSVSQRLVASILVITLFGYSTAWAFAGHASALDGEVAPVTHAHAPHAAEHDDLTDGASDGDHCGHAAAHMTALSPTRHPNFSPQVERFELALTLAASTIADSPPAKPPRS